VLSNLELLKTQDLARLCFFCDSDLLLLVLEARLRTYTVPHIYSDIPQLCLRTRYCRYLFYKEEIHGHGHETRKLRHLPVPPFSRYYFGFSSTQPNKTNQQTKPPKTKQKCNSHLSSSSSPPSSPPSSLPKPPKTPPARPATSQTPSSPAPPTNGSTRSTNARPRPSAAATSTQTRSLIARGCRKTPPVNPLLPLQNPARRKLLRSQCRLRRRSMLRRRRGVPMGPQGTRRRRVMGRTGQRRRGVVLEGGRRWGLELLGV
ncbi:hypothetical protein DFH27DRAFT_88544, partial [Peziza echinospora]